MAFFWGYERCSASTIIFQREETVSIVTGDKLGNLSKETDCNSLYNKIEMNYMMCDDLSKFVGYFQIFVYEKTGYVKIGFVLI